MPLNRYHDTSDWQAMDEQINHWLEERQGLLVEYYQAAQIKIENQEKDTADAENHYTRFVEHLIDYMSYGHFEIFVNVQNTVIALENPDRLEKLQQLLHALIVSAELITDRTDDATDIEQNISVLGEMLTERFDMEDKALEYYLFATSQLKRILPKNRKNTNRNSVA